MAEYLLDRPYIRKMKRERERESEHGDVEEEEEGSWKSRALRELLLNLTLSRHVCFTEE